MRKLNIRKMVSVIMLVCMLLVCVSGCGSVSKKINDETTLNQNDSTKMQIVTTIFPEYDWVKQILGDKMKDAEVTMLLDNGTDLHSYQPTADDMLKIADCDLFIYVGGESDKWVDDALKEAVNKNMKVINLLDVLGNNVKEEEVKEGMEAEEEEQSDDSDAEEEVEYDEHVWLSLNNATVLCKEIARNLGEIDSANKDEYQTNLENYCEKLTELDNEYKDLMDHVSNKTLLFADRFPFRYMVDDYGLDYYAAFVGCSAETEASFDTITFLANKVDELGLNSIFTIEKSDQKIAKTVIKNTKEKNQNIVALDSMQSTTAVDVKNGASYLKLMQSNLNVLKKSMQ